MTISNISMIQQAQELNDIKKQALTMLTEIATSANITLELLLEDVLDVLTNFAVNIENGKGLIAMGGNIQNYAYFLAGLEAISLKLQDKQHPQDPQVATNVIKRLSGLAISGGLVNANCQAIVDFGAKPQNQQLFQKYEQMVKSMKTDSKPLLNAVGQLKIAMNKVKATQPAANGSQPVNAAPTPALQTRPVSNTRPTTPSAGPSRAGSSPSGGAGASV